MTDLRVLVIDDLRVLRAEADFCTVYARDPEHGIALLDTPEDWDEVYLDHDLGYDLDTGNGLTIRPVVEWIVAHAPEFRGVQFYSISTNVWGKSWVADTLKNAGLDAIEVSDRDVHKAFDYLPWT